MSASWAVGAVPWEGSFLDWLDAPKAAHWLDVGCGNGAFTEEILTRTQPAKVTGIDPSGGQIKFAHSREGTKAADCHVGDAQALPFAKATFDASIMALAIAFVPDPAKGLVELVRVTKKVDWLPPICGNCLAVCRFIPLQMRCAIWANPCSCP